MSWLGRISQNRVQLQGQQPAQPGAAKVDPQAFAETLISDKVLQRHGASLAPAAGDMQAIASALQGLKTHQARQFTNAVDQFYSALGRSTDGVPAETRDATIKASMTAMRGLVETLGQHPALIPAMAALSSLLEPRGKVDVDPAAHADAAKKTVLDVVERFEGREGTSSVLFGFRNLVEGYESSTENLTAKARPKVWAEITDYLENTVPEVVVFLREHGKRTLQRSGRNIECLRQCRNGHFVGPPCPDFELSNVLLAYAKALTDLP